MLRVSSDRRCSSSRRRWRMASRDVSRLENSSQSAGLSPRAEGRVLQPHSNPRPERQPPQLNLRLFCFGLEAHSCLRQSVFNVPLLLPTLQHIAQLQRFPDISECLEFCLTFPDLDLDGAQRPIGPSLFFDEGACVAARLRTRSRVATCNLSDSTSPRERSGRSSARIAAGIVLQLLEFGPD